MPDSQNAPVWVFNESQLTEALERWREAKSSSSGINVMLSDRLKAINDFLYSDIAIEYLRLKPKKEDETETAPT